jgi:hypothetical protein
MPLYEVVLRFPDRDEIRLTDRNGYQAGGEVVIDYRRYVVVGTEPPQRLNARERFVLKPAAEDGLPYRAVRIRRRSSLRMTRS